MKLTTLLLTSFVLITQTAFADGLLYQLPEDGTYVEYVCTLKMKFVLFFKPQTFVGEGTIKLSSVGVVTENGKKCRWIELKFKETDAKYEYINKILVSEEKPKAAENVFGKIIRGWEREDGLWVREGGQAKAMSRGELDKLSMLLCGTIKNRTKLKPVMVDSKLGKLNCAGLSGYVDSGDRDRRMKFTTRLHKKAPFGVVSSVLSFEIKQNGQLKDLAKITFTLKEIGKNAKSELPDAK